MSVVASADLDFLNGIGIRSASYKAGEKCASCPAHYGREQRQAESDRGAQRVEAKYSQRTPDAVRGQKTASEATIAPDAFRRLHQAGHSVERIFTGAAAKYGTVQAKRAAAAFIEGMKRAPGRRAVSEADRAFLVGKLGFRPESVRLLDPQRRPTTQVVASVPDESHVMSYPGMEKQAGARGRPTGTPSSTNTT